MLAWATVKVTVTGAASTAPWVLVGPAVPSGMVRVSVEVGMNGDVASNTSEALPDLCHVPGTGGENVGVPVPMVTGAESFTVTTWLEGTSVAPGAGVVEATVRGATAVVGVAAVTRGAYPDPTASSGDWVCVDLKPVKPLAQPVTLELIKKNPDLEDIPLIKHSRLSVMPLTEDEYDTILHIGCSQ